MRARLYNDLAQVSALQTITLNLERSRLELHVQLANRFKPHIALQGARLQHPGLEKVASLDFSPATVSTNSADVA